MKKALTLFLTALMVVSLTACSSSGESSASASAVSSHPNDARSFSAVSSQSAASTQSPASASVAGETPSLGVSPEDYIKAIDTYIDYFNPNFKSTPHLEDAMKLVSNNSDYYFGTPSDGISLYLYMDNSGELTEIDYLADMENMADRGNLKYAGVYFYLTLVEIDVNKADDLKE